MISDLKKLKALALREHRDCVAPSCICGADAHNAEVEDLWAEIKRANWFIKLETQDLVALHDSFPTNPMTYDDFNKAGQTYFKNLENLIK